MLKQEPEQRQNQVIGRVFTVLGMKFPEDDEATDELLAEWREALADLTIDEIGERVKKRKGKPCPVDEFILEPEREIGKSGMTSKEIVAKAKRLYGESDMTFREAYDHLELGRRWGPLPKERT